MSTKILIIPDTQVKHGVPTDHLEALGNYIIDKRPDVIVHIGDHWDMESISTYASAKEVEGRRIIKDLEAGKQGMDILLQPLKNLQHKQKVFKKKVYRPKMYFCLGNHEERLQRYIDKNPSLDGVMSYPDAFGLEEHGWQVIPFLKPIDVNGVLFAHYFYNPMSGRPFGGTCHTKLKNIKTSFVQGHTQGLDMATTTGPDGRKHWGVVAGSFYLHDEGYIGPQANDHWRGALMLHDVERGDFAPCVINMKYLLQNYLSPERYESICATMNTREPLHG